jgi:Uma2 family endonuclease
MEARASSETLAPWAEIVPNAGPMTVQKVLALPDDGWRYEVVEGVLVRVGGSSYRATRIAGRLFAVLLAYVLAQDLGDVTPPDGTYDLDAAGRSRTGLVPDVGFIRADRLPLITDPDGAVPFAPDLAVEVASPKQGRKAMGAKAMRYLAAGTQLVWIIYPRWQQVDLWREGDTQPGATLGVGDLLDGEAVIPGFTHPVAALFQ